MTNRILWRYPEWQKVALALAEIEPRYLSEPERPINPQQLLRAMEVLPPHRRRPVPATTRSG
jgi:hypothetical protein